MFEERQPRSSNKYLTAFAVVGTLAVVATVAIVAHQAGRESINPQNMLGQTGGENHEHLFRSWMKHYNRKYDNFGEYLNRFSIFMNNVRMIEHHNTNGNTYALSVNHFADLTAAEFKEYYLGLDLTRKRHHPKHISVDDLPEEVDWVKENAVTTPKNQGDCGACWTFSTTGALEGLHAIKNGTLESFSEQQLVDCAGGDFGNQGCNGGLMDDAFDYVKEYGIQFEKDYEYEAAEGRCAYDSSKVAYKITGHRDVPTKDNLQLKAALAKQPVSVAIQADQFAFQFYSGGVLTGSCGTDLDHGVLLVGYGVDGQNKYWKIKNSWGPSWGEDGFIRIERTDDYSAGKCGVALAASYPVDDSDEFTPEF